MVGFTLGILKISPAPFVVFTCVYIMYVIQVWPRYNSYFVDAIRKEHTDETPDVSHVVC